MVEHTITPAEVSEVAGCKPSTLRAWHNRLNFLPREESGWRKYSLKEVIAIRVVVVLTQKGFAAQEAIKIAHAAEKEIEFASHGSYKKIAIGHVGHLDELLVEVIKPFDSAVKALDFNDEAMIVLDLGTIANMLYWKIRQIRGLSTILSPLRKEK